MDALTIRNPPSTNSVFSATFWHSELQWMGKGDLKWDRLTASGEQHGQKTCTLPDRSMPNGHTVRRCIYTPPSLRPTTATLLLDAGVDIRKVQPFVATATS